MSKYTRTNPKTFYLFKTFIQCDAQSSSRLRSALVFLSLLLLYQITSFPSVQAATPSKSDIQTVKNHPYFGYNIIIIVDKAKEGTSLNAQRLRYYRYNTNKEKIAFVARWSVSTGAEVPKKNELGRIARRTTLKGYFPVEELREDYYSNSWDGPMVFSVFYDYPRYAIHATEYYNYFKLGRRASGGCTRLKMEQALQLYDEIKDMGKGWVAKVNRHTGAMLKSSDGTPIMQWSYKALVVILENGQIEPTHFGFKHWDVVYATSKSVYDYVDYPRSRFKFLRKLTN